MTIIAHFKNIGVEVLDTYQSGGETWAAIRALEGKPFTGGDKWPVHTEYATINVGELIQAVTVGYSNEASCIAEGKKETLFDLALAAFEEHTGKPWHNTETVWIWKRKAYVRCSGRKLSLFLVGFSPYVQLALLHEDGWRLGANIEPDYEKWAEDYQARKAGKPAPIKARFVEPIYLPAEYIP